MIRFTANGRCASCITDDPITTDSVGIPVVFNFDPHYDGLETIAIFRSGSEPVNIVLHSDTCVVPPDVLTEPGNVLQIGVFARDGGGAVVIPTVWADAGVIRRGAVPPGIDPTEPSPDWTAQVQKIANDALSTAERAEQKADQVLTDTDTARAETAEARQTAVRSAESAARDAAAASVSADRAEQAARDAGYMFFEIDNRGHLIYTRTDNVNIDFEIINGRLKANV